MNFAVAKVLVPPTHKGGATNFAIREASYIDQDKVFLHAINKELLTRPRGKRKLLLFIHGYNTNLFDGLFRLTQLVHDVQSPAVPVLFSWASRATFTNYVYDLNSATIARDDLERTIRLIFQSEAEEVNVVAHSMGNWVTVEAIRQISISGNRPPVEKLGHIILAAPDIDVDVFKSQMRRIGKPKKPYLVMISKDDLALRVSSLLAGGQKRIGAAEDVAELTALGAVVVDLSDISSSDRLGHGKFADLASIGSDLPKVLQRGINENRASGPGGAIGASMTVPLAILGAPIRFISGQR
ncbi:MAG: alpha/beta hydrolase [Beijerinckiaceae bacterium]|nr:alpha/beta hydrolase [Beijerinckiaceae bacterium]